MKEGTIVKTKTRKGTFLGKIDALGNEAYLGIPYCLPAVGERRMAPGPGRAGSGDGAGGLCFFAAGSPGGCWPVCGHATG